MNQRADKSPTDISLLSGAPDAEGVSAKFRSWLLGGVLLLALLGMWAGFSFVVHDASESTSAPGPSVGVPEVAPVEDAERLALFVSAAELKYWQAAYSEISTGNAHKDARMAEDRARIEAWKNYVNNNPTSNLLWSFRDAPSTGPIRRNNSNPDASQEQARSAGRRLEGAAFYALLHGDTGLRDKVKAALVAQPNQPNVAFHDYTRWVLETDTAGNERWRDVGLFAITHAMTSNLIAYDLTVAAGATYTTAQRNLIKDWHLGFARQTDYDIRDVYERSGYFPQRQNDSYPTQDIRSAMWTYAGGPWLWDRGTDGHNRVREVHNLYNNRWGAHARHQGLVGLVFDNAYHLDQAKRWHREFLMFGAYPDGATSDFHRINDSNANSSHLGYPYPSLQIAHWTSFADALARTGDPSLYDFATTAGVYGSEGNSAEGGPQTMLKLNRLMVKHYDGTINRWGRSGAKIDGRTANRGNHVHQVVQQNNYYRDSLLQQSASVGPGMPPWAHPVADGNIGDAGAVVAPMFRWIDIASKVPQTSIYPRSPRQ